MIVAIVGPTGIGKTKLSIAIAKHLNTEIISGDSIQVYRQLDIGSGKVTTEEQEGIVHHLIDIFDPTEDCSVAIYQSLVRNKIQEFVLRNITPLLVGGTGLYIKSVLYDYNFTSTKRDHDLEEKYGSLSNEELFQILKEKDLEASLMIHMNNRKRVLQAISRSETNKMSANVNKDVPLYDFIIIGLRMERKRLYDMINKRVDKMLELGLEQEVRNLYDQNIHSNSVQAIGYKEFYRYFDGQWTKEETIEKIKQHSRNLAKKQFTFFNNQFPVHWVDVDPEQFEQTIDEVLTLIDSKLPNK